MEGQWQTMRKHVAHSTLCHKSLGDGTLKSVNDMCCWSAAA